ncbi:hypothetical protein SXCC_02896 [Gluconacetobacter sp. SXCC-1]|nr:hypothetical protein SXCC_02896 [Gluconacetobacter sp. SXCC-1]
MAHVLGRGQAGAVHLQQRGGKLLAAAAFHQLAHQFVVGFRHVLVQHRIGQQAPGVTGADFSRRGHAGPCGGDLGPLHQPLGAAALGHGHHQHAYALAPRAARAARTVQQGGGIGGQGGMHHQRQRGYVDATGGHVGGDAHIGLALAQAVDGARAFVLPQFTRQGDRGEAALDQCRLHVAYHLARGAEHHGGLAVGIAQHVDHGGDQFPRIGHDGAVFDIGMLLGARQGIDAHGVVLVAARQRCDFLGDGGREQQRAPRLGHGVQKLLKLVTEAQVEHFVRFIQHDHAQVRHVQAATGLMVAQPSRRADHDMRAKLQRPGFTPGVHAANARDDAPAGRCVQPRQLTGYLHGQFTRRRDDHGQRRTRRAKMLGPAKQGVGHGKAEGNGLAGTRLGGDKQVTPFGGDIQDSFLDGGRVIVPTLVQRALQGGVGFRKRHVSGNPDKA